MEDVKWQTQRVHGRDEVLLDIEKRTNAFCDTVVGDVREVMHDYEVDMYRLVLSIAKRYGKDTAYEIMSDTVAEKRLIWMSQASTDLTLTGNGIEKGLDLYIKYFKPKAEDFQIIEQTKEKVVFKRKDFVDAIYYACNALDLDVIEVNNRVYARAMNLMFEKIDLALKHVFLKYQDGWYEEMIELCTSK